MEIEWVAGGGEGLFPILSSFKNNGDSSKQGFWTLLNFFEVFILPVVFDTSKLIEPH